MRDHESGTRRTRHGRFAAIACAAFVVASLMAMIAPALHAADPALPSGDAVIDKSIEASGGLAALERVHSRKTTGSMEIPSIGLKASALEYAELPDRSYVLVASDQLGKIESGSTGGLYWENTQMTGPRIKTGEERALAERSSFNASLHWRDFYKDATTAGIDTIDGRPCYRVVLTPKEGKPETQWYDMGNWQVVKQSMTINSPMGDVPMDIFPSDYRSVEGILMPFRVRQVLMGGMQEMLFATDSVWFNVAIPDSVFAVPPAIQALLEKKPAEDAAPAPAAK